MASIGSVGDAHDNTMIESGNGPYKTECIRTEVFHHRPYKTLADVEFATAGWVERYNNRRLHCAIGMLRPVAYEQAHYGASPPRRSQYESGREPVPVQKSIVKHRDWILASIEHGLSNGLVESNTKVRLITRMA